MNTIFALLKHPGDRFVMSMIVHVTCQPQAMGHWICYIRSQCLFPSFGCVELCFFLLGPSKKRCPGNKKLANQWVPRRISSTGSVNVMVLTFLGCFQTCYSFTILTLYQTGRILQTELKSVLSCRKVSEFSNYLGFATEEGGCCDDVTVVAC